MAATERIALEHCTRTGQCSVRAVERAHILLRVADGLSGHAVAAERGVSSPTVYRVRHRYLNQGWARPWPSSRGRGASTARNARR